MSGRAHLGQPAAQQADLGGVGEPPHPAVQAGSWSATMPSYRWGFLTCSSTSTPTARPSGRCRPPSAKRVRVSTPLARCTLPSGGGSPARSPRPQRGSGRTATGAAGRPWRRAPASSVAAARPRTVAPPGRPPGQAAAGGDQPDLAGDGEPLGEAAGFEACGGAAGDPLGPGGGEGAGRVPTGQLGRQHHRQAELLGREAEHLHVPLGDQRAATHADHHPRPRPIPGPGHGTPAGCLKACDPGRHPWPRPVSGPGRPRRRRGFLFPVGGRVGGGFCRRPGPRRGHDLR